MKLAQAGAIAHDIAEKIRPYCHRVHVAGSIRRQQPEVKDIEIVAIPKWEDVPDDSDLFGERTIHRNLLHRWANSFDASYGCGIEWIKPGVAEIVPWGVKEDGKYWRGLLGTGIKLDLFLATPENFGMILLIRTGSADFSRELVTFAKYHSKPVADGRLTIAGVPVETPEEADVFRLLGLKYIEPQSRCDRFDLREVSR
jgi:DNA polymerase/3'-5' exonuclease PolX